LKNSSEIFEDIFLLSNKEILQAKNNKKYLNVVLSDSTGQIEGKMWDIGENNFNDLKEGTPVIITGKVDKFKDKLQIILSDITPLENNSNEILNELIPKTPKNIEALYAEVLNFINSISNPYLKKLLKNIFIKDKTISDKFKFAPASTRFHHAYRGGLIEHTLSVTKICSLLANSYSKANRDLLITGALLHDIGKIDTYDHSTFKITDKGRLLGHIPIGIMIVDRKISSIKNFPIKLEETIKHLILSHHGELEWGSPVQPATFEALLLHYADNIDSKAQIFYEIKDNETLWQYSKSLRRNILIDNGLEQLEDNNSEKMNILTKDVNIKTLFD
jgi:3'-5' exoribonuclease